MGVDMTAMLLLHTTRLACHDKCKTSDWCERHLCCSLRGVMSGSAG